MLTLGPIKEKREILKFFEQKGILSNENSGCVLCKDSAEILGLCLYDLSDTQMLIRYIEPLNDLALADGILRSTLHVAAEKSIMNAFYADSVPEEFFEKIGFIKNKAEKSLEIDKLFSSCQSCNR